MKITVPADLTYSVEQVDCFLNKKIESESDENIRSWIVLSDEAYFHKLICELCTSRLNAKGALEKDVYFADTFFNWKECFQKYDNLSLFSEKTLMQIYLKNGKPGSSGGRFLSDLNLNEKQNLHLLLS